MNAARALQYVKQANELAVRLATSVPIGSDAGGENISLLRNLESAEKDLTPPAEGV